MTIPYYTPIKDASEKVGYPHNPNINYETFKIGEHCGNLGYDAAEKIRQDLWFLGRAYGFSDEEKFRIERMNILLNHIDYAHKQWNRAALQPQPDITKLCAALVQIADATDQNELTRAFANHIGTIAQAHKFMEQNNA